MQVIYADILFVINVYVTYALLLLTGIITKSHTGRLRLLMASFLSGAYSFIIFLPSITNTAVAITRIPACLIIVLSAYKVYNKRHLARLVAAFLAVNFAFAGLMFVLWHFFCPNGMYFNSGVVYFDIDAPTLVILTALCYGILKLVEKLIEFKAPSNTVYDLKIFLSGKEYCCRSFLDTGNGLTDCFTGFPVVIVNKDVLKDALPKDAFDENMLSESELKMRFIVCSGVSGGGVLPSFHPEKVQIKSLKESFETNRVIIAVTENRIRNGAFGALLPTEIFLNQTKERGEDYAEKTV